MTPFLGYAPDVDPTTPGVLPNVSSIVPSLKGMRAAPSAQNTALPVLAAACKGAAVCRKLDNTTRLFAGAAAALYEAGATSWTDRTRAAGAYALGTDIRWRFAQLADYSLAVAKSEILQVSTSGAFANAAANAPKASIVETANNYTLLFDVNDQGAIYDGADRPHGWWAAKDHTVWTPSVANAAFTGDLKSTPGKIRAGKKFGQDVIAYKDRSMYLGSLVNDQVGWEFRLIPGEIGAVSQECVVDVGTIASPMHIFMGFEDFYRYDGSRPIPLGSAPGAPSPVKQTVFGELNKSYSFASMALHDRVNSRIYFFYPVGSSTTPDKCVVYNYLTNKWGRDDRSVEMVVEQITAGITYDDLGTYYATYSDMPALAYDSSFWTAGYPVPAIFNTSHMLQTLDGVATSSSITTWDAGADEEVSLLSRVQPLFLTRPTSATMTNYYRDNLGDSLTSDTAVTMDAKGRFDINNGGRSANWHRAIFSFTGDLETPGLNAELVQDGRE